MDEAEESYDYWAWTSWTCEWVEWNEGTVSDGGCECMRGEIFECLARRR